MFNAGVIEVGTASVAEELFFFEGKFREWNVDRTQIPFIVSMCIPASRLLSIYHEFCYFFSKQSMVTV